MSAENPYGYQQHKYDKSQPENLAFLQRIRKLLDQYGAAMSVGEVGDDESISLMAQYTGGNDKLNMAYSFNLLTADFSAAHIRKQVEDLESQLNDGWGCWTTGNHDSVRVVSRWGKDTQHPRFAPTILAMLVSLRGSSCLYQGEELGLPEAQLTFEQLQDPYGIAMWPEFKGRDGCRTPMPWHKDQLNAGFSPTEPWLPVASTHVPLAVDAQEGKDDTTLAAYRRILHWRKTQPALLLGDISFLKAEEPVLAFTRKHAGQTLVAVFNLSEQPQTYELPFDVADLAGHGLEGASRSGTTLHLDAWAGWYGTAQ